MCQIARAQPVKEKKSLHKYPEVNKITSVFYK